MESPVQEEYYTSPAQERYYDLMVKCLLNPNVRSDGTINNDKLNQEITELKTESEAGHEHNINDMTQVYEYGNRYKTFSVSFMSVIFPMCCA